EPGLRALNVNRAGPLLVSAALAILGQCPRRRRRAVAQALQLGLQQTGIGAAPAALRQLGKPQRLLLTVLAFAYHLHAERAAGRAGVVSQRFQERLLGDVQAIDLQGGRAPDLHEIRALAPGVVVVVVLRFRDGLGEELQAALFAAGTCQEALDFPQPQLEVPVVALAGEGFLQNANLGRRPIDVALPQID